ncbi:EAL domain-containing protein [Salinisphaera sp. LB1]|uniref:EAL domain-containing protein n=1 Tax=Salinisphaera sp. LB1 TaxID=2183911 RepID=UPI000D70697C|nr:GGDEF domain-containing protein [Salinisphaera sp. LB1]AWN17465.1 Sensory box/GGDEF family protein [Salinisphaera sp. LB1]
MAIADATNAHRSNASNDSANANALIAVIGDDDATSRRLAARLQTLSPRDWATQRFDDFDTAASQAHPPLALLALVCRDGDRFDTATLIRRVEGAGSVPLLVAGTEVRLPPRGACVRAGVCQRIDIDEDAELIDARLSRALDLAIDRRRLAELEQQSEGARARLDGGTLVGATPHFADLIGAESAAAINGQALGSWLSKTDAARLSAAQARLNDPDRPAGRGVILRRASAGATHPLSAHLYTGTDRSQWLSLAPIETTSMPVLGATPIADARMALHRHLASISRWSDSGRLRGLVFVAVDGVPALQQQFGLASTDELLEEVSLFLIDNLADADRCFRFAVGEYVLSIERGAPADVSAMAETLVRTIGDTEFGGHHRSVHVTASVSAIMLGAESTANDRRLQQLVDTGYRLRETGGDAFRECEGDPMADAQAGSDAWQSRLEQALVSDRFRLAFQTVTSLAGDQRRYYDVLLRYVDDHDGMIMPANFLPAAEQAGLMPEIDRWVTRRAARVIAEQAARDVELALFVKLSSATLDSAQTFIQWLAEDEAMAAIDHQQIIFCVREADARSHVAATRRLAAELDRQTYRFALTHFGESSSHAAMLENLTLSFIKLAPAFARQLAEQNSENGRLQRVVDFAREHGVPLIAEHIEDAASMARLWQAGVNYVQGHFIQEPDPAALQHGETIG